MTTDEISRCFALQPTENDVHEAAKRMYQMGFSPTLIERERYKRVEELNDDAEL